MLVLFVTLNFQFEFETANQPGFEPGSPGPIAPTLTFELQSIDESFYCSILSLHNWWYKGSSQ